LRPWSKFEISGTLLPNLFGPGNGYRTLLHPFLPFNNRRLGGGGAMILLVVSPRLTTLKDRGKQDRFSLKSGVAISKDVLGFSAVGQALQPGSKVKGSHPA
jgi:hypothetical protein